MNKKISIVVPVYNVEKYVVKCIYSIKKQSYKNFEAIIVNDGSTDKSLFLCEKECRSDKRFKVVTKENGGLSDARNYGMKYCKSDYVTFIDSDDYVDENYLSNLMKLMIDKKADIACTNYVLFYENGKTAKKEKHIYIKEYNNLEAIENVLYQEDIPNSAWGKLYKMKLFDKISFPKGKLCEDLGTFYKLFEKSKKVVYSSEQNYYYLQRSNSIMGSSFKKDKLDGLYFCEEIIKHYEEKKIESTIKSSKYRAAAECMSLVKKIPRNNTIRKQIKNRMGTLLKTVIFDKRVRFLFKIKYIAYYFMG